ncbi:MAG: SDR family NAD(P)-dependent oxidoreductase [Pseudomonadota bacterium]
MRLILGIILFYGRFGASFTQICLRGRARRFNALENALDGRHVVVTGASGGIGGAVVRGCLAHGARVTAIARNQQKLDNIVPGGHERLITVCSDLADTDALPALLQELAGGPAIDVLVNNVGVMLSEYQVNSRNVDAQFATNLLNPYLLTEHLLASDTLKDTAAVISVASGGMYMAPLKLEKLSADTADSHDGTTAYAIQKRAQVVLTEHWQRTYGDTGRQFYVMHPGWVDTAGVQQSLPTFRKILRPLLRNAEQGADTILWLAATLPAPSNPVKIWFDRAQRPVHAYSFTRSVDDLSPALVEYLHGYAHKQDLPAT